MTKAGRPPKLPVEATCPICKNTFLYKTREGFRIYCSRKCYGESKRGKLRPDLWKIDFKNCALCGKQFQIGGSIGKNLNQKYCSNECAAIVNGYQDKPQQLNPVDAAYIAGFLDGEGNLCQVKPRSWRVTIYQCNEEVLTWIQDKVGSGRVFTRKHTAKPNLIKVPENPKQGYTWQIYSTNAALFIRQIFPYLHVKKSLAESLLSDYKSKLDIIDLLPATGDNL